MRVRATLHEYLLPILERAGGLLAEVLLLDVIIGRLTVVCKVIEKFSHQLMLILKRGQDTLQAQLLLLGYLEAISLSGLILTLFVRCGGGT